MKQFKISTLIFFIVFMSACSGQKEKQKTPSTNASDQGVDKNLPIFMRNEPNTILYDEASIDSKIIANISEENISSLIGLTAMKDAENRVWYYCYYPAKQIEGWTRQVNHWDFNEDERHLPLLQNLTLANLQLGANPRDAKRLLGKPQSEHSERGPLEVSGFIDENCIVTTTTMEYDGIQLIYEDDCMIHAYIIKPGKSFGWIVCSDKECNEDFLIKKFNLTEDNFYDNDEGDRIIIIYWDILSLEVYLDADKLVETIKWNYGS